MIWDIVIHSVFTNRAETVSQKYKWRKKWDDTRDKDSNASLKWDGFVFFSSWFGIKKKKALRWGGEDVNEMLHKYSAALWENVVVIDHQRFVQSL